MGRWAHRSSWLAGRTMSSLLARTPPTSPQTTPVTAPAITVAVSPTAAANSVRASASPPCCGRTRDPRPGPIGGGRGRIGPRAYPGPRPPGGACCPCGIPPGGTCERLEEAESITPGGTPGPARLPPNHRASGAPAVSPAAIGGGRGARGIPAPGAGAGAGGGAGGGALPRPCARSRRGCPALGPGAPRRSLEPAALAIGDAGVPVADRAPSLCGSWSPGRPMSWRAFASCCFASSGHFCACPPGRSQPCVTRSLPVAPACMPLPTYED